jgi:hypothetical protein
MLVELKYYALVSNSLLIEKCIKLALDDIKYIKIKKYLKLNLKN